MIRPADPHAPLVPEPSPLPGPGDEFWAPMESLWSASERMRAVALAGTRLLSARSLEDFVDVLRSSCEQVMAMNDLGIGLYDAATDTLHFAAGFDAGVPVPAQLVPVAGTPSARVIRERQSLVTLRSSDPLAQGARLIGTGRRSESIIRTPILGEDRVLGVILVQSYTPDLYTSEDVEVLETLAAVTATALLHLESQAQRDRALGALRETERRFADLAGSIPQVFWIQGRDGAGADRLEFVSAAFQEVFGRRPEDVLGSDGAFLHSVHPDDRARIDEGMAARWLHEVRTEYRVVHPDGRVRWVEDRSFPVRDEAGAVVRVAGVCEDITARRDLEQRLRQAQKMEAVGQLAAGVAHDFNNLLTVICGSLEFVKEDLPGSHPSRADLDEIAHAATRARALVRQLMTFSRQQPIHLQDVDVGAVVATAERLFRRVLGAEIVLDVHVSEGAVVRADPGQLEQVLLNLVLNARDAMITTCHGHPGSGGTLTIEVDRVDLAQDHLPPLDGAAAGGAVRLSVRDTGHGMDEETRARVFEPFFTTREVGSGTGLGLATAFGIVRQLGGSISVTSAPCEGAAFTILLPAIGPAPARSAPAGVAALRGAMEGRRTILLAEDEAGVRATTSRILRRHGFTVLEARHGADAMLLWSTHGSTVDALLTDIRMPEVGGRQLADTLLADRADLPIVFMSGYSDEAESAASGAHQAFVEKPFTAEALVRALDAVLASRGVS